MNKNVKQVLLPWNKKLFDTKYYFIGWWKGAIDA